MWESCMKVESDHPNGLPISSLKENIDTIFDHIFKGKTNGLREARSLECQLESILFTD